jgi:hypothetical protein
MLLPWPKLTGWSPTFFRRLVEKPFLVNREEERFD